MNEREAEADGPIRQIITAVWANVFGFTVCVYAFSYQGAFLVLKVLNSLLADQQFGPMSSYLLLSVRLFISGSFFGVESPRLPVGWARRWWHIINIYQHSIMHQRISVGAKKEPLGLGTARRVLFVVL